MPPIDVHLSASGVPWGTAVDVDLNAGITLGAVNATATLNGGLNVGLTSPVHIAVDSLPKINIGLDPIRVVLDPLRCHLPVDISVCFNLFGHDVGAIRVCGEAQFITEPYVPNPCECGPKKDGHGGA
jgi:hypothetical protein